MLGGYPLIVVPDPRQSAVDLQHQRSMRIDVGVACDAGYRCEV